jgi:hypothetical protein
MQKLRICVNDLRLHLAKMAPDFEQPEVATDERTEADS